MLHLLRHISALKPPLTLNLSSMLRIGQVSFPLKKPQNVINVPRLYLPRDESNLGQTTLADLEWLLRKDLLCQDAFLLGKSGSQRRRLVMMYLELTQREFEHVVLSRDTTESDLKQRREIINNTAIYVDQPAVKAAINGRVLLLEGIEKVERNVLPVLNNLLENREMHLEDGRLLIPAWRYDKIESNTNDDSHLVRVHPNFRVIALGLPVPKYPGNPLDPPLRSRFQARNIHALPFKQLVESCMSELPTLRSSQLSQLASFGHTLLVSEQKLPDFPMDNLKQSLHLLNGTDLPSSKVVSRLFPFELFLSAERRSGIQKILDKFEIDASSAHTDINVDSVSINEATHRATIKLNVNKQNLELSAPCGLKKGINKEEDSHYVSSTYHNALLSEVLLSHSVSDVCIVGPRGCGKSRLISHFANILHYDIEPILLYQDMTARDLLQQRTTTRAGDTIWQFSPLVKAAIEGKLAILDGLHRLHRGTLSVIQSLVQDRELQLYDGTRLLRDDRFNHLMEETGVNEEELNKKGVMRIHPSFRIVALAEPPSTGNSNKDMWMSSEILSMFLFHSMRAMNKQEELALIQNVASDSKSMQEVLRVTHVLRQSEDASMRSVSNALTTRQLLRIARRTSAFPSMESTTAIIEKACLAKFLPSLPREALHEILGRELKNERNEEVASSNESSDEEVKCIVKDDMLIIGETSHPISREGADISKIPDTVFYETSQNVRVLENLLQDFSLGEHLLLIGNQGVGKNKLIDRLLHLLHKPREYIQLHRDSSVQSLTLAPTVKDGVIVYEDSPLVKACALGHVLVVDEADKAPLHVTCVLKTLVESGEMSLADGRRISRNMGKNDEFANNKDVIRLHDDFRMIVLANRPGFPFLGNDFFAAMGDLFSAHAVDNPGVEHELQMLRQYGPNVSEQILRQLVNAFSELRHLADEGLIGYPYSTREVVNVVKHLEHFPEDSVAAAVRNVFDFDAHLEEAKQTIVDVLHKHGIPLGVSSRSVFMATEFDLPSPQKLSNWASHIEKSLKIETETKKVQISNSRRMDCHHARIDRSSARGSFFSEQHSFWTLPVPENSLVNDIAVMKDEHQRQLYDLILVTTTNPLALIASRPIENQVTIMSLSSVLADRIQRRVTPRLAIKALPIAIDGFGALLHEELSHTLLLIDPIKGIASEILHENRGFLKTIRNFIRKEEKGAPSFKMIAAVVNANNNQVWFHVPNSSFLEQLVLNKESNEGVLKRLHLPFHVGKIFHVGDENFVLEGTNSKSDDCGRRYLLNREGELLRLDHNALNKSNEFNLTHASDKAFNNDILKDTNNANLETTSNDNDAMVMTSNEHHALLTLDSDKTSKEVWVWPKSDEILRLQEQKERKNSSSFVNQTISSNPIFLPQSNQIVSAKRSDELPREQRAESQVKMDLKTNDFLEIIDLKAQKLRFIPVAERQSDSIYRAWYQQNPNNRLRLAEMSNENLVSVDTEGTVRLWETGLTSLQHSFQKWREMTEQRERQLTISRDKVGELSSPKHGKMDPLNEPHVGGDTWAGGTGGRSTAGLGGVGGPYRLDAGHNVHQINDELKSEVPQHVLEAARQLNRQAFEERLRDIRMSEHDAQLYAQYAASVQPQVKALRTVIDGLQARSKERQWLKNRTMGELDDSKLIEGIAGEKSIYRQRGEPELDPHAVQEKPKHLRILADVSGSMYRFNGHDQRLQRELEAVLMIMEALDGFESRLQYDIVGHSGEEMAIPFVDSEKAPKNEKQRLQVLRSMHAHSQFCFSGDHTLPATAAAINDLAGSRDKYDECFVVVLSDANFDRYGISPRHFGQVLLRQSEEVPAFAIFIGSLGNQAQMLTKNLPAGKAFVCLDTAKIPSTLKTIFAATMLN